MKARTKKKGRAQLSQECNLSHKLLNLKCIWTWEKKKERVLTVKIA